MDLQLVTVVVGAMAGGFVQGLTGSSFGLVAMAVWAFTLDPALIGPLVVFGSLVGQMLSVRAMRRGFSLALVLPFISGGLVGVPAGVALLPFINPIVFKFGVGVLLVVWCPAMLFARELPHVKSGGPIADAIVGFIGGVMGGLGGLTGPAPALWATLRHWDRDKQRAVFQGFNLSMHIVTMSTYILADAISRDAWRLFPAIAAAVIAPLYLGVWVYERFDDATFNATVLWMLAASGVILIATTLPQII